MQVRVAFTRRELVAAPLGIVIDVLRATSTICQALAGGYRDVVCVGGIEDARALAGAGVALAGERHNVRIDGFDYGNSPREFAGSPHDTTTLVLTTTNGTGALLAAADVCESVIAGSLLNLAAVVAAARAVAEVTILCAGVEGGFAIDDAYVAGRIAAALGGEADDAAAAAIRLAASFGSPGDGIGGGVSADNIRRAGLGDDVAWCARESVLEVVPRVVGRGSGSVTLSASDGARPNV